MRAKIYEDMLECKISDPGDLYLWSTAGGQIGYENVFDYSLGNPSVPVPDKFTRKMIELLETKSPMELHGYSPTLGNQAAREAVAASLKKRFHLDYARIIYFMTSGAASSWRMHSAR